MNSKILRMKTISLGHCHRKYKIPMNTISSTSSSHFINKLKANHTNERIDPSIESAPQCSGNIVLSISPSLIYVQNPLTWLSNKFRLKLLRYTWDHDFVEREFKRGATQATVVMTEHVRDNQLDKIQQITTPKGFIQISKDLHVSQKDPRVQLLRFRTQDIRRQIPVRVHFMESKLKRRHCFIDMFFVGLRRIDDLAEAGEVRQLVQQYRRQLELTGTDVSEEFDPNKAAVFAELFVRFHKEYSAMSSQQWNIAFYKVASFDLLHLK